MTDINKTLKERGKRYGAFPDHARITQALKAIMRDEKKWGTLSDDQKESLEMIASQNRPNPQWRPKLRRFLALHRWICTTGRQSPRRAPKVVCKGSRYHHPNLHSGATGVPAATLWP